MFYLRLLICLVLLSCSSIAAESDCNTLERIESAEAYNSLVCSGLSYFEEGLYQEALDEYLKAADIRLFDTPNYRLNARISHMYLLMGELVESSRYLEKSELTLSLLAGIYSCEPARSGGFFISDNGQSSVDSIYNDEVAMKMCGGAYDYIYNNRFKKLSRVVLDGRLTEYHIEVAALLKNNQTGQSNLIQ